MCVWTFGPRPLRFQLVPAAWARHVHMQHVVHPFPQLWHRHSVPSSPQTAADAVQGHAQRGPLPRGGALRGALRGDPVQPRRRSAGWLEPSGGD